MGLHAWKAANSLTGIAAASFTWSNAATANRSYLNDGRMDQRENVGASVASGINLIINMGSAVQLIGFAVLNSNAAVQKTDATLKVEASSNATFSADVNVAKAASTLYSAAAPRNKDHVVQFTANFTKQYWRLTWTWTGSVTNFSIGELYAYASITQLSRRSIYGSGETHEARVALSEMQYGGQRATYLTGPVRQLDLSWEDLQSTARDELEAMHVATNFGATPFLWVNSYEATALAAAEAEQECVFGRLQKSSYRYAENSTVLYTPDGFPIRSEGREAGA